MASDADELLEEMRKDKRNWKRHDLETLYYGFGFIIASKGSRAPHDKVYHPEHPELITFLAKSDDLGMYNITQAIRLIDRLKILEQGKKRS